MESKANADQASPIEPSVDVASQDDLFRRFRSHPKARRLAASAAVSRSARPSFDVHRARRVPRSHHSSRRRIHPRVALARTPRRARSSARRATRARRHPRARVPPAHPRLARTSSPARAAPSAPPPRRRRRVARAPSPVRRLPRRSSPGFDARRRAMRARRGRRRRTPRSWRRRCRTDASRNPSPRRSS